MTRMPSRLARFFAADSTSHNITQFALTLLGLATSLVALALSVHLTGWSNDLSQDISRNEMTNANDQRCADALLDARGALGTLSSGYVLQPLDRDGRLTDWEEAKQHTDAVSVVCAPQLTMDDAIADYYEALIEQLTTEYLNAPTGEWDDCVTRAAYAFSGLMTQEVLGISDEESLPALVNAGVPCS